MTAPRPLRRSSGPIGDDASTAALVACRTEPEQFGLVFDRDYDDVLAFFASRVRSAEAAADLCAETFAAALAGVSRFDPHRGTAAQWLSGIARHQLYGYWRDLRVSTAARDRLGMPAVGVDADTAAVLGRVDAEAHRHALDSALARLEEGQRRAVELRVIDGLDYADIAIQLGCRPGAARVRVHRGLRRLRDALAEVERG
jgi:RNA polymerase sigma factor (sigma-70 family)